MDQFNMKDPTTASSRIYLGNIGENANRNEIENIFRKYGNIRGVLVSRNFGFVQFENDESANNAIANEHDNKYFGRKIIVKNAIGGRHVQQQQNTETAPKATIAPNQGANFNAGNSNNSNNNIASGGGNNNNNENNIMRNAPSVPPNQSQNAPPENPNFGNNTRNNNENFGGANQGNFNPNNFRNNSNNFGGNSNNFKNNSNNFGNNKNQMENQQNQDMMNRGQRQPWRNKRGMNQNERERSPFDQGRNFNSPWNNSDQMQGDRVGNNSGPNFRGNSMNSGQMPSPMNNNNASMFSGPRNPNEIPNLQSNDNVNVNRGMISGNLSAQVIRAKYPDANDCEIIVVSKTLTEFAESIESRLKRLGLMVDLLFPNPDVAVSKVLANIASRGVLYAIVVTPINLERHSASVNLLFGQPTEHRNMPIDDAIEFVYKNYQKLMRGEQVSGDDDEDNSSISSIPMADQRHPDQMQHLIKILAENRSMTVLQFDALIKYLQERRDIQYKKELGPSAEDILPSTSSTIGSSLAHRNASQTSASNAPPPPPEVDPEAELQKRIMEILNKPSITSSTSESTFSRSRNDKYEMQKSTQQQQSSQDSNLLSDPKVQRALDSLLSNNSFNM